MIKVTGNKLIYDGGSVKAYKGSYNNGEINYDPVKKVMYVGSMEFPMVGKLKVSLDPLGTITKDRETKHLELAINNMVFTPNIVQVQSKADTTNGQATSYTVQFGETVKALTNTADQTIIMEHVPGETMTVTAINLITGATTAEFVRPEAGQAYRVSSTSRTVQTGSVETTGGDVNKKETTKDVCVEWGFEEGTKANLKKIELKPIVSRYSNEVLPGFPDEGSSSETLERNMKHAKIELTLIEGRANGVKILLPGQYPVGQDFDRFINAAAQTKEVYLVEKSTGNVITIPNKTTIQVPVGEYKICFLPNQNQVLRMRYELKHDGSTTLNSNVARYLNEKSIGRYYYSNEIEMVNARPDSATPPDSSTTIEITQEDVNNKLNYYTYIVDPVEDTRDFTTSMLVDPPWIEEHTFSRDEVWQFCTAQRSYAVSNKHRLLGPAQLKCLKSEKVVTDVVVDTTPITVVDNRRTEHTINLQVTPIN